MEVACGAAFPTGAVFIYLSEGEETMGIERIVAGDHKKSTNFSTALRIFSVSMILVVLGIVTVAQAQVIPPRYQQGAYNLNVSLPPSRLCTACADGSVPERGLGGESGFAIHSQ